MIFTDNFKLGAIESPLDLRDYDYSMITCSSKNIDIPKDFILDYDYPILNQGLVGSCVAHTLSCMKSYIDGVNTDKMYSVGFIYGNREEDDWQGTGMITREALKNLVKYGDCIKTSFPINEEYPDIVNTLNKYNKQKLLDEAHPHKSLAYIRLDVDDIKEYLVNHKKPIAIAVNVYDNFYDSNQNGGKIPSTPKGNKRGSHLMLCIGFKGDTLVIINSWGDYNGDKGKYYLDINSEIIKELWVLEDKKQIKEPIKLKYTIGWNKDNVGWWYSTDGLTYEKNDWKLINGKWYYFNQNGYALESKWVLWKDKWYYLNDDCSMATGWLKYKNEWYYLESNGAMVTGTKNIDNTFYDFDYNGKMVKEY